MNEWTPNRSFISGPKEKSFDPKDRIYRGAPQREQTGWFAIRMFPQRAHLGHFMAGTALEVGA